MSDTKYLEQARALAHQISEECVDLGDYDWNDQDLSKTTRLCASALAAAVEQEREACAKLCEDIAHQESERTLGRWTVGEYQTGLHNAAKAIRERQAAIRARGGQ